MVENKDCDCCGKEFHPQNKRIKCCSRSCARRKLWLAGVYKPITKETRRKQSESQKLRFNNLVERKKVSERMKGKFVGEKNHMWGKSGEKSHSWGTHPSEITLEKLRKAHIGLMVGKKNGMFGRTGDKNPRWLGGLSFLPYSKDFNKRFKVLIRERDGFSCQICNISLDDLHLLNRRLQIHHVDYDKLLSIPQNAICLCTPCHMKTNFNREHWTKFFQSMLHDKYGYEYQEGKIVLNLKSDKKDVVGGDLS